MHADDFRTGRGRCDGSLCNIPSYFGVFLSCAGSLERRGSSLPQYWQNQRNDVYCGCFQYYQRGGEYDWNVCPSCRSGVAVSGCEDILGSGCYSPLFPKGKRGVLYETTDMQMECRTFKMHS